MRGFNYLKALTTDRTQRAYRVEDLVAQGLNRFRDWTCNAGVQTLYIDYDGSVWIANCAGAPNNPNHLAPQPLDQQWGHVGSIITDSYAWPTNPVICPFDYCGCGADICASKCAQPVPLEPNQIHNITPVQSLTDLVALGLQQQLDKHVLWDLGRWCNYDCSYCWSYVHNKTDRHKELTLMSAAVDRIMAEWSGGSRPRWAFGGGEPTVNPSFLPLLSHISSYGCDIMVVSNGSRSSDYYRELAQHTFNIHLSVHFDFWNSANFTRNVRAILEVFRERGQGFLDIKLMCRPGRVSEARRWKSYYAWLLSEFSGRGVDRGAASMVPIRDETGGMMVGYEPAELAMLLDNM